MRIAALLLLAGAALGAEKELWQPYYIFPRTGERHLDLTRDWSLGWRGTPAASPDELAGVAKWIAVMEPSSVQTALFKAGEFPNPYVGLNSEKYKWVDEKVWYYRKSFTAPPTAGGYAFLYFHGLDYFSRVWLNGQLLGRHEGMFGGPAIEVSKQLVPGENRLVVEVKAGNWGQKATFTSRRPGRIVRPWVIAGGVGAEMFFPLGMWQGARLEIVPAVHLERPFLSTRAASAQKATLHLSVEVLSGTQSLAHKLHPAGTAQLDYHADWWVLRPQARKLQVEFTLREKAGGRVAFRKLLPANVLPGRNWVEADIDVPEPKLWWPNGLGKPNLYTAGVTLKDGAAALDTIEFEYGIRSLRVEMTPGPRVQDRWSPWQFVVNERKFFLKGINWMPADILLDLPRERYHWLLSAAKNAGVQMVRVWGGGLLEPEAFYSVANELGILVWQDFPIGNTLTPDFPQPVWEAQVVQTVFRLRNHPSLALWCGGNEFNPYAEGNTASIGILERTLADFDNTRPFRRTSPDNGSRHDYPDMDPAWYARKFPFLPFMAETGMHNIPNAKTMRAVVSAEELERPLERMYSKDFAARFPEFRHHFVEFEPARVPRMLSRASHVADVASPSIETIAEATQIGAGEFYQVMSEALQSNYPVTAGVMPWVFKRPWPAVAIQVLDGFGHPTAPYYFLKRTYEPVHVAWKAEHLLWAPGEAVPFEMAAINSRDTALAGASLQVRVLDDSFRQVWTAVKPVALAKGPSVARCALGSWTIPAAYTNRFFFVVAQLRGADGQAISRQVYWPRSLAMLADTDARAGFRKAPKDWPTLEKGPWLKPAVAANATSLVLKVLGSKAGAPGRELIEVGVTNRGAKPAFPVTVEIDGVRNSAVSTDSYFWLEPGETRTVTLDVMWRNGPPDGGPVRAVARAWGAADSSQPVVSARVPRVQ